MASFTLAGRGDALSECYRVGAALTHGFSARKNRSGRSLPAEIPILPEVLICERGKLWWGSSQIRDEVSKWCPESDVVIESASHSRPGPRVRCESFTLLPPHHRLPIERKAEA